MGGDRGQMAHWYYKGTTTTPIAHPERGPMVLTPKRRVFEAPASAVAHLISIGLVVPARVKAAPAVESTSEPAPADAVVESQAPRSLQEEEPRIGSSEDGTSDVVESAGEQQPAGEQPSEEEVVAEPLVGSEQPKKKSKRKTESSEDR